MPSPPPRLAALVLAALSAVTTAPAQARVDGNSAYTKAQTYSGALRYVRVDLGYEVVERDADAAYLIFKYVPPGQSKQGAVTGTLEVVQANDGVRVFVTLPRMPEYHERLLRDGLLKKLRDEYGAPTPPPKKAPEKPAERAPGDKSAPAREKQPDE